MHPTRHPRSSRYCSSRSDAAGTHTSFRLSIQHRSPSFIRFLHFSLSYCFFLLLFSVFLIFTRLFHISSFFIITFGCYNRRNSSSFTGPSFSPTTRYPVFTNGASDSTTTPLLSYLRFRSPSWLRFQRTRTISIVNRLWDR